MLFGELGEFLAEIFALLRCHLSGLREEHESWIHNVNHKYSRQAKS